MEARLRAYKKSPSKQSELPARVALALLLLVGSLLLQGEPPVSVPSPSESPRKRKRSKKKNPIPGSPLAPSYPLFLDDLKAELAQIEGEKVEKNRKVRLRAFQRRLAGINIFDPACGSGNFLTESYLSLRKLENRVLEDLQGDQAALGFDEVTSPIQVSIGQLYVIEINDFAVAVAKTALWIAEEQMMEATKEILLQPFDFLPLKSNGNIHEGNALHMDWNDVLPVERCAYIVGNPLFYGARNQSKEQKAELVEVFHGAKNSGNVDYVAGWYMKAAEYTQGSHVRCTFVSMNSICQGEQLDKLPFVESV